MDQGPRRRFGAYDFDLTTGELRRDGVPIPLQRQPARALACLVARAGTLVPRADLHAAIWGQDVHVDFDRGLNYCIRQLREVLIDDAKAPRYIETIARQGYRFVAPVDVDRSACDSACAGCSGTSAAVGGSHACPGVAGGAVRRSRCVRWRRASPSGDRRYRPRHSRRRVLSLPARFQLGFTASSPHPHPTIARALVTSFSRFRVNRRRR